jgi:Arm DNA-binding domain
MVQKKLNFTDLSLRTLPQGEYWDTKLPAFGFRVGKTSRTFFLKKNNRRIKIGRFPSVTLQTARSRAMGLKGDSSHTSSNIKLGEAIELFLATHCQSYRPASKFQAEYLFRKLEPLRHKKLSQVTTYDLTAILDVQKQL